MSKSIVTSPIGLYTVNGLHYVSAMKSQRRVDSKYFRLQQELRTMLETNPVGFNDVKEWKYSVS